MKTRLWLCAALAGLTAPALAQDSTAIDSGANGLPGDALDPYVVGEQVNNYVVDLATITTTWGTQFGVGPSVKTSKADPAFFNNLMVAQAASPLLRTNVPYRAGSYALWNQPEFGVNADPTRNNAPATVAPVGDSNQFAVAFAENGSDGGIINSHVVTSAFVNYDPATPSRLYVQRIVSAVNGTAVTSNGNGTLYVGAIDADGNVHYRSDDFNQFGLNPIVGNNILRTDNATRNTAGRNEITNGGGSDATTWLVAMSPDVHTTPGGMPESAAGRPIYFGTNFNTQLVYESSAGVLSTSVAHLGTASDSRGGVAYSKETLFGGTIGTGIGYGVGSGTNRVTIWGLAPGTGAPSGSTINFDIPATITDGDDSFVFPNGGPGPIDSFQYHVSQVAFQGGNNMVALRVDQNGNALLAAPVNWANPANPSETSASSPRGGIAVARFDPTNVGGTLVWTMAGYNDDATGKAIKASSGGAAVGRMVSLNTTTGGAVLGPSVSAPVLDALGNVWFLSAVERFSGVQFGTSLLRAVYNPSTFSYELEEVLRVDDVIAGLNSATNYQIDFLQIADANSVDSGTIWSGNALQSAFNNTATAGMATSDSRSLGGLVLNASIIYDVDNNGMFTPVTGAGGDPSSRDQEYNVLMYVGSLDATSTPAPTTYCTGKTNSLGCVPFISFTGAPSATSTSNFTITMNDSIPSEAGFLIYSFKKANLNFHGAKLCVKAPFTRTPAKSPKNVGGGCSGWVLRRNFNATIQSGLDPQLTAGQAVRAQWFNRDPADTFGFGDGLSNGINFIIAP